MVAETVEPELKLKGTEPREKYGILSIVKGLNKSTLNCFYIYPILRHKKKMIVIIVVFPMYDKSHTFFMTLSIYEPSNHHIKEYISYWEWTASPRRLTLRDLTQPLPACSALSVCKTADRAGGERLGEVSQRKTTEGCCPFSVGYIFFAPHVPDILYRSWCELESARARTKKL